MNKFFRDAAVARFVPLILVARPARAVIRFLSARMHGLPSLRGTCIVLLAFGMHGSLLAESSTWIGSFDENWGVSENWGTGVVPADDDDDVVFSEASNPSIVVDGDRSASKMIVRDDVPGTAGTSGAAKPSTQSDCGGGLRRSHYCLSSFF